MKKKLASPILIALLLSITGCNQSNVKNEGWDVVVSGKVGFPGEGDITIKSWGDTTEGFQIIDFDRSNYTYKETVHLSEPGYFRINFFDKQFVDVILYKSAIEVNVDGDKQNGFYEILGSPEVKMFQTIRDIRSHFNGSPELAKLGEEFNDAVKQNNEDLIHEVQAKYQALIKAPNDSIAQIMIDYSPSVGVLDFLSKNELDPDQYLATYEKVAASLQGEWANYQMGKDFIEAVSKMKAVAIGSVAPEISLPDPTGEVVKLSSLRGKYVLVDFWAKWCGPCRQENPNVVRMYKKYKSNGFEVFGVSLDRNKQDWVKAIEEDGLEWTQVSDLKYFNSEAARNYNINAIPFSFLLNPDGVIIAKNLRGRELEAKLKEIFKSI